MGKGDDVMKKEKSVLKNCKCCSGGAYHTSQYKFFSDGEKKTGFLVWVCNNCHLEKSYKGLKKEFTLYLKENEIPKQGITELSNELGLISTEVSQNIERWTTRGAK